MSQSNPCVQHVLLDENAFPKNVQGVKGLQKLHFLLTMSIIAKRQDDMNNVKSENRKIDFNALQKGID